MTANQYESLYFNVARQLTLGNCVRIGNGERLLHHVRHHKHGGAVAEKLANDGTGVGQRLELIHVELRMGIAIADLEVLLTDPVQNIGALSSNLEEPGGGTAGGVLGSKEEGKDSLGNLIVVEHAQHRLGLLHAVLLTLLLCLAPALRVNHVENPGIHDAGGLATSSHADLALGCALGKLGKNHVGGLLAVPSLGEGDNDGEVDQLKSSGDEVVVVGDLLDGVVGNIVTDKGAEGDRAHELAKLGHKGNRLAAIVLGDLDESLEVLLIHLLLARQVELKGLAGEETVQSLAEIDVGLTVEEDPVVGAKELVGNIDDARLDVHRGIEHLTGHVSGRSDNDEPGAICQFGCFHLVGLWKSSGVAHLWKTETQLRGPLTHLA